jgi:dTDP-4-dehydrorhamnose reductase
MTTVGILGSLGMLGSHLTNMFSNSNHEVIEFNRKGIPYAKKNNARRIDVSDETWIQALDSLAKKPEYFINCIGKIKHRIDPEDKNSVIDAVKVNGIFSLELTNYCTENNINLVQVFTDCVFAGDEGEYNESSKKSPIDLYGYTKVVGESLESYSMNLRTSFIGKEIDTNIELMSWLLSVETSNKIRGFNNHIWNGVTAFQLSKIILSIIDANSFRKGTYHLLPSNKLSKYQLLIKIKEYSQNSNLVIDSFESRLRVNRTLTTLEPEFNIKLWRQAGYESIPSIEECVKEYFLHFPTLN